MISPLEQKQRTHRFGFLTKLSYTLTCFGALSVPMTGVNGPSALGELARTASVWFFFPALLVSPFVAAKAWRQLPSLRHFIILFFVIMLFSFVANIQEIPYSTFRDRGGIEKALSSAIVIVYGFLVTLLIAGFLSSGIGSLLLRFFGYGVFMAFFFGSVEILWWYFPAIGPLYFQLVELVRPGFGHLEFWGRMTSVGFEPHALGLWLAFALPLSFWLRNTSEPGRERRFWTAVLFCAAFMLYFSDARSGQVVCAMAIPLYFLPRLVNRLAPQINGHKFAIDLLVIVFITYLTFQIVMQDYLGRLFLADGVISNLSRFSMNTTAFRIAADYPIFGSGIGQFGFQAKEYVPSWGWHSYELIAWLVDMQRGWPVTYSLPGRLLAELGVLGFLAWYGSIYILLRRVASSPREVYLLGSMRDARDLSVLLAAFLIFGGVANDSFANMNIWIALAMVTAFSRSRARPRQVGNAILPILGNQLLVTAVNK